MTRAELDYILGTMLDSHKNVSDLNFTVDKPLQVEASGELDTVTIEPPVDKTDAVPDRDDRARDHQSQPSADR